jgi:ATP-dependent DNA helicase RecG
MGGVVMILRESETIELKEIVTDEIKKEIIAFANSEGGSIYIGVKDDGTLIGVADPDGAALQISNMVRDAIKPDVTMFLHYETLHTDGVDIVIVTVQRGTSRPYYLAKKGMRPEGIYLRQGYSSVPATDTAIRLMIKDTDGDRFEKMRSLEQDLTFEAAAQEFSRRQVDFAPQQMHTLKFIHHDGIYTNLGLLLSDQCMHTIKVAVFEGTSQENFQDRKEFSGSLFKQLNDTYDYLDMHNQTRATFEKLLRIDTRNYPEVAVREALLNLLVHRDYAYRASALISIYTDRMEFVSIGGLMPGITLDDVMIGLSVCRNQNLANVFYRLQLIEAYGTGFSKILHAYEDQTRKPLFESTQNAFKITLPNRNFAAPIKYDTQKPHIGTNYLVGDNIHSYHATFISPEETAVLEAVKTNQYVTRAQIEKLLGISASTAVRLLRQMVDKNLLTHYRNGRIICYSLPQAQPLS